jgi:hypothetical protein
LYGLSFFQVTHQYKRSPPLAWADAYRWDMPLEILDVLDDDGCTLGLVGERRPNGQGIVFKLVVLGPELQHRRDIGLEVEWESPLSPCFDRQSGLLFFLNKCKVHVVDIMRRF